jgi:diguanylate cyclase (GGDEF)-like protein
LADTLVSRHRDEVMVKAHKQPLDATAPAAVAQGRGRPPRSRRWAAIVIGHDRPTRIRVKQWLIAAVAYIGSSMVMIADHAVGWLTANSLAAWLGCLAATQILFYVALRSGLSARCKDPALTIVQILAGLVFADWAFVITGPGRAVALMPILFILIFGAFLLHWKKMAVLTGVALAGFGTAVVVVQRLRELHPGTATHADPYQDLLYFGSLLVLLPLTGFLAAQLSRMRSALHTQRSALAAALADVQRLAEFDELTGLANRRRAGTFLATLQARAQRNGPGFSVVLIDLDNFKHINDTLGHDAGDRTLRAFADAARPLMRDADLMARWGGEEFLFIMPDTDAGEAYTATLRLLECVRGLPGDKGGPISFSAGIAHWQPDEPVASIVARADHLMYEAKDAGRNRILGASGQAARCANDRDAEWSTA